MHIRRYGPDFARRRFLEKLAGGIVGSGLLMPVWDAVAENGELNRAYPDEVMSIEEMTGGQLAPGDFITSDNVDLVQDLLDPIRFLQIKQMGRRLRLVPTTEKITDLSPLDYIEATLRNRGLAHFDAGGNVIGPQGGVWVGGNPFPEPTSAEEIFAGITLTGGRHDVSFNLIREYDLDANGNITHQYDILWIEYAPTGRVTVDPKPVLPGHEDKIRYNTVLFTGPADIRGTSFLNIWPYDQREFPKLFGYLPQFKRVRSLPTSQRFEPLIPGSTLYLSDAWTAGDPFLTWGNYRIVGRGPALGAGSQNFNGQDPNWAHGTHGGPKGQTFWDMNVELVPEAIVVEAEPISYARAPISRKRVWFDARTLLPVSMVTYDRNGELFKSFEGSASIYVDDDVRVMDGQHPYWSWCTLHSHDIQNNRMTRMEQVREIAGGYTMRVNESGIFEDFMTVAALKRLGT